MPVITSLHELYGMQAGILETKNGFGKKNLEKNGFGKNGPGNFFSFQSAPTQPDRV